MSETTLFTDTTSTAKNKLDRTHTKLSPFQHPDRFVRRHIGPSDNEVRLMLETVGFSSLDKLIDTAVPDGIRLARPLKVPPALGEHDMLQRLRAIARRNQVCRSYLGMGYHDCIVPPVIQRNILENPGWYTHYTPYQAEIAQGRLEALLNFQTMICDLTGLEIANASLLDEATAAGEAMTLCHGLNNNGNNPRYFVAGDCHPQTMDVLRTRAKPLGIELVVGDHRQTQLDQGFFGALVQYPTTSGEIPDYTGFIEKAHEAGALVTVAADLLSLTLLRPPGEFGADIAVGSAQRFGVPLGYGGPHAAYFATRNRFKRQMPGRLVGVSKDIRNRPALRLALQTREQHIRREKATSNICTAQVLLAVMASMYAVYHGPAGLKQIATRIHDLTRALAVGLKKIGFQLVHEFYFDTLQVDLGSQRASDLIQLAARHGINLRFMGDHILGISLDETTSADDVAELLLVFNRNKAPDFKIEEMAGSLPDVIPSSLARTSDYLRHPVFNRYHSETEMLRYLRRLEMRDLSLTTSMIPLGSCTMKLNATAEMFPVSWPAFNRLHPFVPAEQAQGYQELFGQLEEWLAEITGFAAV
jgi:glycine dehydrogenase